MSRKFTSEEIEAIHKYKAYDFNEKEWQKILSSYSPLPCIEKLEVLRRE